MDRLPRHALIVAAGFVALLPLAVRAPVVVGHEGVVELATECVLLVLVGLGIARRSPWIVLAAAIFFLEEINYGQSLFGFTTPRVLDDVGSRSTDFNLHNIPALELLWRPIPAFAVALCALRPWPGRAELIATRLRLPAFVPTTILALVISFAAFPLAHHVAGKRPANECAELAAVLAVFLGYLFRKPVMLRP